MSVGHYHTLCQRFRGRAVEIRTHNGRIHRGIIQHVTTNKVYLQPLGRPRNLGGFGYGAFGFGGFGGFGGGWGWGIALAAIAALALIPGFFW